MKFEIPQLSAEQRARVQQALDLHAEVTRLDAAVDAKERDIKHADQRCESAAKTLAERDTDLALATDDTTAQEIERDVKKLTADLAEVQSHLDRQVRIRVALLERLSSAEAALQAERESFQHFVRIHSSEAIQLIGEHVAESARPLIEALRIAVIASAASGGNVQSRLGDTILPDLRGNGLLLNGHGLNAHIDGAPLSLSDIGEDPVLADLYRVVGEPRRAFVKLCSYTSRAARLAEQARAQLFRSQSDS
jgi:hypothetical protein